MTQSEINNAVWNIYRSENEEINYALQINPELIPGGGTTNEVTEYTYIDEYDISEDTTYYYWLEAIDFSGNSNQFSPLSLYIPEDDDPPPPPEPILYQNYPNPFN